jgi:hypothetical protein
MIGYLYLEFYNQGLVFHFYLSDNYNLLFLFLFLWDISVMILLVL